MSETKVFRVTGEINKQKFFIPMTFSQEIRAAKMEHAVEQVYTEMGSRHRAKRNQITIFNVEEIKPEEKAG
ncbi:MAG: 50S ribosomal protein L18Ae [Candidatus Bathyarchaeota archaeon]|nr:50S ribosomal protein L18Ae [Candidatus Bathyarchaeota archaeon]